ncbi:MULTISPECIES: type II and III secretion system protein family protein [Pseudomonas]|jgi:pilus assembly protein CpaC|uniref:Type II and III secretion system protein family protein n=2 Tax=Pseudomonas putida TaxID=303 RepID=A0A1X0Z8L7_PSEPU|nr:MULTISPECIES: type II and III secretion system protein family protein [Pseudomonas]MDN5674633.1 type II and III secretion system protein family protein [Pseudomonas sp.]EKT4462084.1 type II and III secretion system protein family protein [Pseudomonas putida]EKT4557466.1 type II and III secretion system protein family protein [Pseudomonas putida]ELF6203808.1 type II and III secretion system protein family protein [Pseudomonas putida]ELU0817529.1 type II and III secretion system protein famil
MRSSFLRQACCTGLLAALLPQAQAAGKGCEAISQLPSVIEIDQGLQQELRLPLAISRVAVGEPKVADVQASGERGVVITAVGQGNTTLMLWTACAPSPHRAMVFVKGRASADMAEDSFLPSQDAQLISQVQADIRFVEVRRTKYKEAGARLFFKGSNNSLIGSPGTVPGTSVSPGSVPNVTPSIPLDDTVFNIVWGGGSSRFLAMINALENSGFAYTLARPSLTVLSGQTASFLAGGEIPIPVPSAGSDNVSIEYKEFGVRLALTPTVISQGRITLKVAPEVSELDYSNVVTIAGTQVPGLTVRRTDTSIALADGESFIISGLVSNNTRSAVDRLPGLGSLPVLGAFFRNSAMRREETELLMIVTPHLVQPLAANARLPQLPGENLRTYDPSWGRLFFLENGNFDGQGGLSQ